MKSEFPLLSRLILNGDLAPITSEDHLVDAQEVTDTYWQSYPGAGERFYPAQDLGCLIPPFPYLWIESTARIPTAGEIRTVRVGYKLECKDGDEARKLLGANPPFAPEDLGWTYLFRVYFDPHDSLPAYGILFVDRAGMYLSHGTTYDVGVETAVRDEIDAGLWQLGKAAFFALSMMNCRNVSTSITQTRARGGKKTKRRSAPSVEYRVIHLPKSGSALSRGVDAPGTTKLHTARGHFKTYAADAPLMGKHTGTYYWGWQVRGRKENGEIVSNYKVGTAS